MDDHKILQQNYEYQMIHQNEEETDLFKLFFSVFAQWKVLVGVTSLGTLFTLLYVLFLPQLYDVVVKVAPPSKADIKILNVRGYEKLSPTEVFRQYFNTLRSSEVFKQYLIENGWYKKLFPERFQELSEDQMFSIIYKSFKVEIVRQHNIGQEYEILIPELVSLTVSLTNEALAVQLINQFVEYTNDYVVKDIALKGKDSAVLEQEQLIKQIDELRKNAKVEREFLITKINEQNLEKIAGLKGEIELLLIKAKLDKESKIALLEEAYDIAKKVGIKKLTTIEAIATADKSTQTTVSLSNNGNKIHALMGTIYLNSELEMLRKRQNDALFIPQISQLEKEIEGLKKDENLNALIERKSDDPYIEQLSDLMKRQDQVKNISFNFADVRVFRLDHKAFMDGEPEKPNRKLIVIIGFIVSGFISFFVILIINGIKIYQLEENGQN